MSKGMKLQEISGGTVVDVHVRPNSTRFRIAVESDEVVVFCREATVKGRVNRELTKELSRLFKRRVEILSGSTSRQKRILIRDISTEKVNEILSAYARATINQGFTTLFIIESVSETGLVTDQE